MPRVARTLGRYSITIIIGLLCVTAPRNCTTFGCLIVWSNVSSSLNALLHEGKRFNRPENAN